ncbi:MAG: hypothetical protein GY866_05430 [Proteobacteria bacterium]|nr:hypothetical protein [Pseudomonadota bacterium]
METLRWSKKDGKQYQLDKEGEVKGESGVLRSLHGIQVSVPDKYFFVNKLRGKGEDEGKKKKDGLFSGTPFFGSKKKVRLDIDYAREQVKSFHNSFLARGQIEKNGGKSSEIGMMGIAEMNDFRRNIREAAENKDALNSHRALDAIIKFVDLKNSGVVANKQVVLQDCLRKVGKALHDDGGLSMFHTTWFLSLYREYLRSYGMFQRGLLENAQNSESSEAKAIVKKLNRTQFEVPHYLQLVKEERAEVKQIVHYSQSGSVKVSKHGQKGCTREDIKKIFLDRFKGQERKSSKEGNLNEVNIIMAYAMLFARIPMMYEVVESIKNAIPNLNTDTNLYKQKITIAQKINVLDIASGLYKNDGTKEYGKKVFHLGNSVYKYCTNVISENGLESAKFKSDIYTHPFLKQALILIVYKNVFLVNEDEYLKLLKKSVELLKPVFSAAKTGSKSLAKIAGYADIYEKRIQAIIQNIDSHDQDHD